MSKKIRVPTKEEMIRVITEASAKPSDGLLDDLIQNAIWMDKSARFSKGLGWTVSAEFDALVKALRKLMLLRTCFGYHVIATVTDDMRQAGVEALRTRNVEHETDAALCERIFRAMSYASPPAPAATQRDVP